MRNLLLATALLAVSCMPDPKTGRPVTVPDASLKSTVGYVENAKGFPDDVVYGWDLRVASDTARWRECPSVEECTDVERERTASDLVGTHAVGKQIRGAETIEVFRLTLKSRRRNHMPRSP